MKYLRAYEDLPRPQQESFEVSCELVNGRRIDRMRLAILGLRRADVLGWMSACGHPARFIDGLLFENTTDACFGIGLADYESGAGNCRIKAYNEYGTSQSQEKNVAHVRPVKLGASDEKGYEVLDGVKSGEKVVVLSYTPVKDGGKVSIGKPGDAAGTGAAGTGSGSGKSGGRKRKQQQ